MFFKYILFLSIFVLNLYVHALANDWKNSRVDAHAPVGVMGDHAHETGEVMFSYRYRSMMMDGNRSGQSQKSVSDVLVDFMVSPIDMIMSMHMVGAMYAPTDKFTLMVMLPHITKSMAHRKRNLTEFTRQSHGVGDLRLSGLYQLYKQDRHHFLLNTGLSLPMGSIDEKDGQASRLPYPMQLGSGTYDLSLGITYARQFIGWSYGGQTLGLFRLGKNKHNYVWGNRYAGTAWISKHVSDEISVSFRTVANVWDDIRGSDSSLVPKMVPTAQTDRGGKQVDITVGINYYPKKGFLSGNRLALEIGAPVLQSLDGTQLETDWWSIVGWQYVF